MAAIVPSINNAAIAAISDKSTREVLRSMADSMAVRNGDIGSGDNAFLTLADLGDKKVARRFADALAPPIIAGIAVPGSTLAQLADQLQARILASAAWQNMFKRLTAITAPDTVPGSAAYMLLQEAKARAASITRVEMATQGSEESIAALKETLTTSMNGNAAAIQREESARTTADSAVAEQLNTMVAETGRSFAGITEELRISTNNDNALASAINTLWARVGSNQALIQTGTDLAVNDVGATVSKFEQLQATMADINGDVTKSLAALRVDMSATSDKVAGMAAKWGVNITLGKYVSGVSLNSSVGTDGTADSSFIVLADVFAIGAPGKPDVVPFAIDAKTGLVAIRGDLFVLNSIEARSLKAKTITAESGVIGDLAVDTLQIQNNAVTVPYARTYFSTTFGKGDGNWMTVAEGFIDLTQPGMVFASVSGTLFYGRGWVLAQTRLIIDGIVISTGGGEEAWVNASHSGGKSCTAGRIYAQLQFAGRDDRVQLQNPSVFMMGAKK